MSKRQGCLVAVLAGVLAGFVLMPLAVLGHRIWSDADERDAIEHNDAWYQMDADGQVRFRRKSLSGRRF